MVRAKFTCIAKRITQYQDKQLASYEFSPVVNGSDENKQFFQWTPSGKVELGTVNESVSFEIGKEYYLDFSLVE